MGDAEPVQEAHCGEPQKSEAVHAAGPTPPPQPPSASPPPPPSTLDRLQPAQPAADPAQAAGDRPSFPADGYLRPPAYPAPPPPASAPGYGHGGGGGGGTAPPGPQKPAAQHEDPYSFSEDASEPAAPGPATAVAATAGNPPAIPAALLQFQFPKKRGRKPKKLLEAMAAAGLEVPKYKTPVRNNDPNRPRKKHDRFNGLTHEQISRLTLPDYLSTGLDIVFIGINPGMTAAYKGHHYAGPGNHFWKCLYMAGLIPEPLEAEDDFKLMEQKMGFTNIVSRTTKGSQELTRREIKEGGKILLQKLKLFQPKIAVFNGKGIYEVFSGRKDFMFGKQPEKIEGTQTSIWVMPSSSARCAQLPRALDKVPFYSALKKFRDHLNGEVPEVDDMELTFEVPKPARRLAAEAAVEEAVSAVLQAATDGDTEDDAGTVPGEPPPRPVALDPLTAPVKKKRGRPRKVYLDENGVPLPERPRKPARRQPAQNGDASDPPRRGRRKKLALDCGPAPGAGVSGGMAGSGALSSMYQMSEQLAVGASTSGAPGALTPPGYAGPPFPRPGPFSPSYIQQQQQDQAAQQAPDLSQQQQQQSQIQQQQHGFPQQQQCMSQEQQQLRQQAHLSQHQLQQQQQSAAASQQSPQHPQQSPHHRQQYLPHPGLRDEPGQYPGSRGGMFPPYPRQQGQPSPPVGYQAAPGGPPQFSGAATQFCRSPAPAQFAHSPAHSQQFGQQSPVSGSAQYGQHSPSQTAPFGQQSPAMGGPQFGQQSPATSGPQFGQHSPATGGPQFGQQSPATGGPQFGQQSPATGGPQFGQHSPATGGPQFGQQSPATGGPQFGQQSPVTGPHFGHQSPAAGGPQFGQQSPATGSHQFGQHSPATGAQFGQHSPVTGGPQFGQQSPTTGPQFGQQSPATGPQFGQQSPATGGPQFGQQSPATGPQFGQQSPAAGGPQFGKQSPANGGQFGQSPAHGSQFGQSPAHGSQFGQSPSGGALYRQSPGGLGSSGGSGSGGGVPGSPAAFSSKCSSLPADPPGPGPEDPAGLCLTPPPTSPSLGQPDFEAPASMPASDGADGSVTSLLPKDEPTDPSSASVASSQPSFSNPTTPADGGGQFPAAGSQPSPAHYPYTPSSQPAEFPPQTQQTPAFGAKSDMATKSLSDLESLVDQIPSLSGGQERPTPELPVLLTAGFSPQPQPQPPPQPRPGSAYSGYVTGWGGVSNAAYGQGGGYAGGSAVAAASSGHASSNFSVMSLANSSVPTAAQPHTVSAPTGGSDSNPFSIQNLATPAPYGGAVSMPGTGVGGFSPVGNMSAGVYPYGAYTAPGYGSPAGAFPYGAAGFAVPPARFGYASPYVAGAPAYHQQAYTQQAVYERLKQEQMEMRFGGF